MIKRELLPVADGQHEWGMLVPTMYGVSRTVGMPVMRWEATIEEGTYPFALKLGLRRDFINLEDIKTYMQQKYGSDNVEVALVEEGGQNRVVVYVRGVKIASWRFRG